MMNKTKKYGVKVRYVTQNHVGTSNLTVSGKNKSEAKSRAKEKLKGFKGKAIIERMEQINE